jgi:alpha-mannosidase
MVVHRAVDLVHESMVDRGQGVTPDLIWVVGRGSGGLGCAHEMRQQRTHLNR